jgi:hypothetical protein
MERKIEAAFSKAVSDTMTGWGGNQVDKVIEENIRYLTSNELTIVTILSGRLKMLEKKHSDVKIADIQQSLSELFIESRNPSGEK